MFNPCFEQRNALWPPPKLREQLRATFFADLIYTAKIGKITKLMSFCFDSMCLSGKMQARLHQCRLPCSMMATLDAMQESASANVQQISKVCTRILSVCSR